jgi:outer membrane protein W
MPEKRYLFVAFVMVALVLFTKPVFARDAGEFGVGMRLSHYFIQDDSFTAAAFVTVEIDSKFDDSELFELNLTYFLCKFFSLELSAGYIQTDLDASFMGFEGRYGEIEQFPILLTGCFHWPVNEWFRPYAGGGVGYYLNDIERADGPGEFFNGSPAGVTAFVDDGFGFHVDAGIELFISDHFALSLDVKYTWLRVDIGFEGAGLDSKESTSLNAVVVGAGLKYYF